MILIVNNEVCTEKTEEDLNAEIDHAQSLYKIEMELVTKNSIQGRIDYLKGLRSFKHVYYCRIPYIMPDSATSAVPLADYND